MTKPITIRDVAQRAGVTPTTVSSVLSDTGRVSEALRIKIKKLAVEMGYEPRLAARLLRAKTTGQIGLILPQENPSNLVYDGHTGPILSQFVHHCESRQYPFHIEFTKTVSPDGSFHPPRMMTGGLVDAAILGGYLSPSLSDWLVHQARWPWVNIDEPAPYCILSAMNEGIYNAARHLAALGHRKIGYLGGIEDYLTYRLGREGFQKAVEDFGLDVNGGEWIQYIQQSDRRQLLDDSSILARKLLLSTPRPTALICHNSVLARAVIYQALLHGIKVPQDISIISVGVGVDAERSLPRLSTIEHDFSKMVISAVDLVKRLLKTPASIEPQKIFVSPSIIQRETVAAPIPSSQ